MSRTLEAVARICRRMEASSGLAASAISSSPTMEPVILSSRKRLAVRERNRWSMQVFFRSSPSPYSLAERAARSTAAMSSSSRVLSAPPMWARWREAATGLTPEKEGLPRRPIMVRAASVWSRRCRTSSGSVSGRRRRARCLASALTACSLSSSSTRGSSRVRMDLSNRSLMVRFSCQGFSLHRPCRQLLHLPVPPAPRAGSRKASTGSRAPGSSGGTVPYLWRTRR